jgi:hypothetical protein
MKKLGAVLVAIFLGMECSSVLAGVVMTQEIITNSGSNNMTDNRTILVQGNKQKVEMHGQTIVLDLDGGKMLLMDPSSKTYTELPFPPTGPMASMMQNVGGIDLDFKKTGGTQTLSGYKCREYSSTGKSMMGEFSAKGCFAADAPGAGEYAAFTKAMAKKFEAAGMAKTTGNQPDGVPMVLETTTKLTNFNIPGMPPEQAERLKQMMANRPPTTSKSTTTSIKTADLPASTFEVPAGYTERKIAMPMGRGPSGAAPAPRAAQTPYQGE